MAIPPDPIDEVISEASAAVMARVTRIVERGKQAPLPKLERPGLVDQPGALASQRVELVIDEVLFGDATLTAGAHIEVTKPEGDYTLSEGNHGPFLLGGEKNDEILGRYGPDSYRRDVIEAAHQRHRGGK